MEIVIKKWKSQEKNKELNFTDIKLFFEINVVLNTREKALIHKYYDPVVAIRSKEIRNYLSDYRLAMDLSEKIRDSSIERVDKNFQLGGWDNIMELRGKLRNLIDWSDDYPLKINERKNNENLSKYKFSACVHDGVRHLHEAEAIIEAICTKLRNAISYLNYIDEWDGESRSNTDDEPKIMFDM